MSKKKVTAPLSYDPGKGRPKEYLAYLNWQEMQALRRLNGNNMERGPKGLPSFPPDDSLNSGQTPGTGNWTGSPGGTSYGGAGGTSGGGSDSGNLGGATGSTASSTAGADAAAQASQSADTAAQESAAARNTAEAARNAAFRQDAAKGGIGDLSAAPDKPEVTFGGGQITGAISQMAQQVAMPSAAPPVPTARPSNLGVPNVRAQIAEGIMGVANRLGIDPVDLGTAISYETAGTFSPTKKGPTTQWGAHKGLIQFGEPQAEQYGVDWNDPVNSQLGPGGAVENYLKDAGVKPGMGMLDVYSAINAGQVGRYNVSDEAAGGAPGTVADKVSGQMSGHRKNAQSLLGDYMSSMSAVPPSGSAMISDPAASVALKAMTSLPSALSNVRIPAIPEAPAAQKAALAAMPGWMKQSVVNKAVASAVKNSGFNLADTLSSGIKSIQAGLANATVGAPPTQMAAKPYQERLVTVGGVTREVPSQNFAAMDPADQDAINKSQQTQTYTAGDGTVTNQEPAAEQQLADVEYKYAKPIGPKNVSKDIQEIMAEQDKWNQRGLTGMKRVMPGGTIVSALEGVQKLFTGKDMSDIASDLKRSYLQADEDQQAAMRAKYPDMRRFAVSIGDIPPATGNQYAGYTGGTPAQELGGKSYQDYGGSFGGGTTNVAYNSAGVEPVSTDRPSQYYLWDLGVGIPSPGDPDYNEYRKYRKLHGSSTDV